LGPGRVFLYAGLTRILKMCRASVSGLEFGALFRMFRRREPSARTPGGPPRSCGTVGGRKFA